MFAIPNVLGCAAFGYVIRTPERSRKLVKQYGGVMSLFTIVTIAFHLFFIAMISKLHYPDIGFGASVSIPISILLVGAVLAFLPSRFWPILAVVVWLFSLIVGISILPFDTQLQPTHPWKEIAWLWPITTFGFVLCPYLDPTFHHAIQTSPSKHSFAIFGVTFAAMIGVTCIYQNFILVTLPLLLGLHILIQSTFTIGAHIREGWRSSVQHNHTWHVLFFLIASCVAVAVAHRSHAGDDNHINDYIRFFVFYGLIFPAVVSTFMFTNKRFTPIRTTLFCFVALLSLPLLEAGYLHGVAWLSVLPVLVFLTWAFASMPDSKNIQL